MSDIVTAVIRPKGRIVEQFLKYFAVDLFPDHKEIITEAVSILERDAERVKSRQNPLSKKEVFELMWEEYTLRFPELRLMLRVSQDYGRGNQPYRVVFDSLEGHINGMTFRLYGDQNPIETLSNNYVNFAVASSDLLLAKFKSGLLSPDLGVADPAVILANLPGRVQQQ